MMDAPIRDLRDVSSDQAALAGGKGANLARLLRLGFPVPPGFIVTTAAYRAVLDDTGLAGADPEQLSAALLAVSIPDAVRAPLLEAHRRLGGGAVAVRSSATAEDLAAASFAGQHDTFLNVTGERALLDAVRGCWASLWSPRAVAYRRERGWDDSALALAVVVQAMAPAEWAGVLFTADPVSGRRDRVVIEAVQGLGEALVSGEATGHRAVVARRHLRLLSGAGVLPASLPADLARLGLRIEAAFGEPQDVEWAVAGRRVAILQARPLTALPAAPRDDGPREYNRLQRAGAANVTDRLPLPPYPFDVGLFYRPLLQVGMRAFRSLGFVTPPLREVLVEVADGVIQVVPPALRPTLRTVTIPVKLLRGLRADMEAWLAECRATLVARAGQIDAEELRGLSERELLDRIEELQRSQRALLMRRFAALLPSLLVSRSLPLLLRLAVGGRAAGRLETALLAAIDCTTTAANRELGRLARQIRAAEPVRALFLATGPAELPARLGAVAGGDALRDEVAAFLRRYGYRETVMAGAAFPAWRDDPALVYGLLKGLVAGETAALDDDPARAVRARAELDAALARGARRLLRPALHAMIARARRAVAFREESHYLLFLPFTVVRRLALEVGRRLVMRGALAAGHDIFYLEVAELREIESPEQLRERVERRRAARQSVEGVYTAVPAALLAGEARDGALTGTPASPGRATGAVRVIRREQEFWTLRPGEVLVAPYTNPAWTPLFAIASAVVVDGGGMASHAAIVAREYGLPAVMGTREATRVLCDGQRVLVDGDRGRVVPLDNGPGESR